jgi:hypothetical protein
MWSGGALAGLRVLFGAAPRPHDQSYDKVESQRKHHCASGERRHSTENACKDRIIRRATKLVRNIDEF